MPYRTTALGSFASYAVSFTLGFPIFTGGTVRYWIYSRAGVRPGKIASLTVVAGVTFWLGMAVVIAFGLLVEGGPLSEINHLAVNLNRLIGLGVLGAICVYLFWVRRGRAAPAGRGLHLELPGLGLSLGQMALGVLDLCSAAAVLYVLLPSHEGLDFFTFASVYVFACLLGHRQPRAGRHRRFRGDHAQGAARALAGGAAGLAADVPHSLLCHTLRVGFDAPRRE